MASGSRFKGYDDFVVQELRLEGRLIRYRRERWLTLEGKLLVAPLPAGLHRHFGPELVRFILLDRLATWGYCVLAVLPGHWFLAKNQ